MSSFKNLVNAVMKHGDGVIGEDSPPGWKGTVKAMKDKGSVDNPYALSWWMKNKGYKSHKKASGAAKERIGESIRVWHPSYGRGTVNAISESYIDITWDNLQTRATVSANLPFSDAKYLSRLQEEYSSKPSDVDYDSDKDSDDKKTKHRKKRKKMKEGRTKIDEGMVAIGMAGIGGTMRPSLSDDFDLEKLTLADLMLEDDDNKDDESHSDERKQSSNRSDIRHTSKRRSDYVNVPAPSDTVLTNQENQPKYDPEPLATHAGFEDATDGMEPDGDYGSDLLPVDAPDVPKVRDLDDTGSRKNTRKSGEGEDTHEAGDKNIDFEGDKPEEDEDNQMKKKYESNQFDLTANDLGLTEGEHGEGSSGYAECSGDFDEGYGDDDMQETHDTESGEVALTPDFMHKLFTAISAQSPDDSTLQALCDGLKAVSQDSGATLDVSDWDAVKAKASEAYGGTDDAAVGDEMDSAPDAEMNAPDTEMEPGADQHEDDAYFEEPGSDDYDDYDYEEDRAEGDGEIAGPEGGEEHEGKTKMMDKRGDKNSRDDSPNRGKEDRMKQRRDQRKQKQQGRYMEDGSSGTPVSQGSSKGPGGGSTTDLSKPKTYKGKVLGTQTGSGPGGGSTSNDGQKPSPKGGSNLLPANDKGNQLGAAENPFSKGQENPRNQKALAAESRKKNSKKKLDEAIMLGMSSIPHIGGGGRDPEIPDDAYDDTDELKMIKRRAGMANWWK